MGGSKTASFSGHRPQSLPWGFNEDAPSCVAFKKHLRAVIEKAIQDGYSHFISGAAWGIDLIASRIVLDLKKKYGQITLECAIPHENQATAWPVEQQEVYYNILSECDKTYMVSKRFSKDVYRKRNEYMVNKADLLIAVYNKERSGTGQTVRMAERAGKKIIIINPYVITE